MEADFECLGFADSAIKYIKPCLTKDAESIVDGDDDDATVARQHAAVIRISAAPFVALAVHEDDHGVPPAAAVPRAGCNQ